MSLTQNPDVDAQGWAAPPAEPTDAQLAEWTAISARQPPQGRIWTNKLEVRLALELPEDDPKLMPWVEFARRCRLDASWLAKFDAAGGGGSADWFLYLGTVPPKWIVGEPDRLIA